MKVLKALLEERDQKASELDDLRKAVEAEGRDLTDEEETRSKKTISEIDELDERIDEENRAEAKRQMVAEVRARVTPASDAKVVAEPTVYGPDSPNSYYVDLCRRMFAGFGGGVDGGASQRLAEWSHQVERKFAEGGSTGKSIERQLREVYREHGEDQARANVEETRSRSALALEQKAEQRAVTGLTTGGGATATAASQGAAFVSPFIAGPYAPYREYGRAFVEQCNKQPLPPYGMNVYIPHITAGAEVAAQPESEAVAEKAPTMGYLSGALTIEAGQVKISQAALDRAAPGFDFDRMIFDQLQRDYAPKVDAIALAKVIEVAHKQEWLGKVNEEDESEFVLASKEGAGGFYGQISKAKAYIRTSEGTVLNPSHCFLEPARWEYIAAQSDANGRPVVVPDYAGAWNAAAAGSSDGDAGIEGNTGYRLNGLRAFTDANIPVKAETEFDQCIVGDLAEVYWYEGTPVTRVIPQTYAQNLQVLLQLYSYVVPIVRYPNGLVLIEGAGMAPISYID
ncbi:MAG TPA: hypothetical protein VGF95_14530 [Solirubrobacteraceae bacterium]|jgi:hypothetical protein